MSTRQRGMLIRAQACFSKLTSDEVQELSSAMIEKNYAAGDVIVNEDSSIDTVFIIASGQVEVSRQTLLGDNANRLPVAKLYPGESIGLHDAGFVALNTPQKICVTAITPMKMLLLPFQLLQQFFIRYPHIKMDIVSLTDWLQRLNLVKQLLPFQFLPKDRLHWLAKQIEAKIFPEGTVLFKQNDSSDYCYFMRTGHVEIISKEEHGEHRIEVRTPNTLFGEATLIAQSVRTSTLRTLAQAEMLVLSYAHLHELMVDQSKVARTFMSLMVDKKEPEKNPQVSTYSNITIDGQSILILKNPVNGIYFKLSDEGGFVWEQLNGQQTIQDITLSLADKYNIFAPDTVGALISKLSQHDFITSIESRKDLPVEGLSLVQRIQQRAKKILQARTVFSNADQWITKIYGYGAKVLFTSLGKILVSLINLFGLYAFTIATSDTMTNFKTVPYIWLVVLLLIPFSLVSSFWHELGRALASKSFGYRVQYMGVGWDWFTPVAFVDTSDTWLSTPGPRITVNLAGFFFDLLGAAIVTLFIFIIPNVYIQTFLWVFALFIYLNGFRRLSPMHDSDGYAALMDVLNCPELRKSSIQWLRHDLSLAIRNPSLFKHNKAEVCYWLLSGLFLVAVGVITYLLQVDIFSILGIVTSNLFVICALPIFVVLLSSLTLIDDLRNL